MLRVAALAGAVILSASCGKSESTEGLGTVASTAGSGKASGGFSADLAKDLAGSKPAEPADTKSSDPGKSARAGSDGKPGAASGDGKSAGGDGKSAGGDGKSAGGDGKSAGGDGKPAAAGGDGK